MWSFTSPGAQAGLIHFSNPKGWLVVSIVEFTVDSENQVLANRIVALFSQF